MAKPRPIRLVDVTLRDAHQCLWATRMTTAMMRDIAPLLDRAGFEAIDLVGGAVFDVRQSADGECQAMSVVPSGLPLRLHTSAGNWLGGRAPNEFHVHLLPSNRDERDAALVDLQRAFIQRR